MVELLMSHLFLKIAKHQSEFRWEGQKREGQNWEVKARCTAGVEERGFSVKAFAEEGGREPLKVKPREPTGLRGCGDFTLLFLFRS